MPSPADSQSKSLSCTNCRQRKIKCDKTQPCSGCRRSNIECVFPPNLRLPRGRQGGSRARNAELTDRINRLEGLVKRLGGKPAATENPSFGPAVTTDPTASRAVVDRDAQATYAGPNKNEPMTVRHNEPIVKADGSRYLSGDFWSSLSGEVDGLRQLLNETSDDEDDMGQGPSLSSNRNKNSIEPYFFFKNSAEKTQLQLLHPSSPQIAMLSDIFFSRVDPFFKVLHRPTAKVSIIAAAKDLDHIAGGSGQESLMFAIYYAAITTLTAEECIQYFRRDKESLLVQYKYGTETALANADLLNSMELVTLQAFVIFLIFNAIAAMPEQVRYLCELGTKSAWTLTSLAVRIAQALELHRVDDSSLFPPFEAEMRRRLWWQINVLDIRDSEDRGSVLMIHKDSFSTTVPCNVNDEDIDPQSQLIMSDRVDYTDMTFTLVTCEVANVARHWNSLLPFTTDGEGTINKFSERLESNYLVNCDTSVPIQWFTAAIIRLIQLKGRLLQQYPLHTRQSPSRAKSKRTDSLETAISLLEVSEEVVCHESAAIWAWWASTWSQWHPLAVILAELCIQPRGPLADRAWAIVNVVFEREGERVADSKKGTLWRPIRKLLEKAQAARVQNPPLFMDTSMPPPDMACQPLKSSVTPSGLGQLEGFDLNESLGKVALENFVVGGYPPLQSQQLHPPGIDSGDSDFRANQESSTDTVHWENWIEFLQSSWDGQVTTSLDWTMPT